MQQPEGFIEVGKEHLVCKLKHSLYGLKQAPRFWNSMLGQSLNEMGFKQSSNDLYVYTFPGGVLVGVYVDNIVICEESTDHINKIKKALCNKFKIKDLGELKYFLGVNVFQNHKKGTVWIVQQTYTKNMLKKFGFDKAKSIGTPVDIGTKLHKATESDSSELVDQSLYINQL